MPAPPLRTSNSRREKARKRTGKRTTLQKKRYNKTHTHTQTAKKASQEISQRRNSPPQPASLLAFDTWQEKRTHTIQTGLGNEGRAVSFQSPQEVFNAVAFLLRLGRAFNIAVDALLVVVTSPHRHPGMRHSFSRPRPLKSFTLNGCSLTKATSH